MHKGYDHSADIWSLGILIYEFIHGYTPFKVRGDQATLFKKICEGQFEYNNRIISREGRCFLNQLINLCPSRRLGCVATAYANIYDDKWIRKVPFSQLLKKEIKAPIVPKPEMSEMGISMRKQVGDNDPELTPEQQKI